MLMANCFLVFHAICMFLSHFSLHKLNIQSDWQMSQLCIKQIDKSITGILLSDNCTNILTDCICMLVCFIVELSSVNFY